MYLDVTFHPNIIDNDISFKKVACIVEGADPLFINLIGKCVQQPTDKILDVSFDTIVRQPNTQKVVIKNPTNQLWRIKASVSSNLNYFKGKDTLEVPANG